MGSSYPQLDIRPTVGTPRALQIREPSDASAGNNGNGSKLGFPTDTAPGSRYGATNENLGFDNAGTDRGGYGGGAGGKMRSSRRSKKTPYDRPSTGRFATAGGSAAAAAAAASAPAANGRTTIVSRIKDTASNLIYSSASYFFSSVFKRGPPVIKANGEPHTEKEEEDDGDDHSDEVLDEEDSHDHDDIPADQTTTLALTTEIKEAEKTKEAGKEKDVQDNDLDIGQLEDILKQTTWSREEVNRLTEILQNRVRECDTENKQLEVRVTEDQVKKDAAGSESPINVARAYMGEKTLRTPGIAASIPSPAFQPLKALPPPGGRFQENRYMSSPFSRTFAQTPAAVRTPKRNFMLDEEKLPMSSARRVRQKTSLPAGMSPYPLSRQIAGSSTPSMKPPSPPPRQSSQTALRILETLEKLSPSPKGKFVDAATGSSPSEYNGFEFHHRAKSRNEITPVSRMSSFEQTPEPSRFRDGRMATIGSSAGKPTFGFGSPENMTTPGAKSSPFMSNVLKEQNYFKDTKESSRLSNLVKSSGPDKRGAMSSSPQTLDGITNHSASRESNGFLFGEKPVSNSSSAFSFPSAAPIGGGSKMFGLPTTTSTGYLSDGKSTPSPAPVALLSPVSSPSKTIPDFSDSKTANGFVTSTETNVKNSETVYKSHAPQESSFSFGKNNNAASPVPSPMSSSYAVFKFGDGSQSPGSPGAATTANNGSTNAFGSSHAKLGSTMSTSSTSSFQFGASTTASKASPFAFSTSPASSAPPSFSFGAASKTSDAPASGSSSPAVAPASSSPTPASSPSPFTFSSSTAPASSASPFTFTSSTTSASSASPFTFSSTTTTTSPASPFTFSLPSAPASLPSSLTSSSAPASSASSLTSSSAPASSASPFAFSTAPASSVSPFAFSTAPASSASPFSFSSSSASSTSGFASSGSTTTSSAAPAPFGVPTNFNANAAKPAPFTFSSSPASSAAPTFSFSGASSASAAVSSISAEPSPVFTAGSAFADKQGAFAAPTSTPFQFASPASGTASTFQFGSPAVKSVSPFGAFTASSTSAPDFSLNAAKPSSDSASNASPAFGFAASQSASTGAFTFSGQPTPPSNGSQSPGPQSPFTFGSQPTSSHNNGQFVFGGNAPSTPKSGTDGAGGFSLGATAGDKSGRRIIKAKRKK